MRIGDGRPGRVPYFLVLNTSKYGNAGCPSSSLKFPNFWLLIQIAYVLPASSLTGRTHVRLSDWYLGLPSTVGNVGFDA